MNNLSILLLFPLLVLISCASGPDAPDVSGIKADVEIKRFDRDFFSIDTQHVMQSMAALEEKYPGFLPLYLEYFSPIDFLVRNHGKPVDEAIKEYYAAIKPLYDSVAKKFPSTGNLEKELEQNFRYVKHYFPEFKIPAVVTTVESLNPENPMEIWGTTYYRDTLIISLQMFLGKDFSVYDPAQYPEYLRRRFDPAYMVANSMRAIANELYPEKIETGSLLEQMLEKGKRLYLLKKLLPYTADTLLTGYSAQQMDWVKKNEGNIWGYINQNENLYTTEQPVIQTYIGEAPFTATLPHNNQGGGAPGNLGPWIGMRIIETYAQQHEAGLHEILKTPARKIFQETKYRPG